jgi:hypothetical protein
VAEACAAAGCAYLFYLGAVGRVAGWGASVRTVFDLYRDDVLKKLGYGETPKTRREERDLWLAISQQLVFGDPPFTAPRAYKAPALARTVVTTTPSGLEIQISGGVGRIGRRFRQTYQVRLAGQTGIGAAGVTLSEILEAEEVYVWNSGRVGGVAQNPAGVNPLTFDLGPLPAAGTVEVVYEWLRVKR